MNASWRTGRLRLLLVVLGMAALSGCAFGTRHVELSYPPKTGDGGGLVAAARADTGKVPGCCEVILAVSDRRTETRRIGNVRNGFGIDTADVVTDSGVTAWVAGAFRQELAEAGYTVIPAESDAASAGAVRIEAEITKVYCDVIFSYEGDVWMNVYLSRQDNAPIANSYHGSGSAGLNWAATSDSYAESLARALRDAVTQVMTDLAQYQSP